LFDHQSLSRDEAHEVMKKMAEGHYNESQIAAFISVYLMRSIELDEILGFREALLSMAVKLDFSDFDILDIVGTGGDEKNTFNISTAACFVVAGAGYQVVKHGNYAATSVSGSSNVLEYFGAKFTTNETVLKRSLDASGFAYLHAPIFNPAMKNVAPVRKSLGVRTFFNVLGPLISPARPLSQCLGVYNLKLLRLYSYIYQQLGIQYSIVHSLDGYDEISLTDSTVVVNRRGEQILSPEQLGYSQINQQALYGGSTIEEAAGIFGKVLDNQSTPEQRNVVLANAAVAIQTLNAGKSLNECSNEALRSLESGAAKQSFVKFLECYQ
jgi:anthranilate phosphoribosyltransferase